MIPTSYLLDRKQDAFRLHNLIESGAKHNYSDIELAIIKSASESPNGFAYVNGTCLVITKKPLTSGKFVYHYTIHDL